jgi:hypothetical protein
MRPYSASGLCLGDPATETSAFGVALQAAMTGLRVTTMVALLMANDARNSVHRCFFTVFAQVKP